MRARHAAVGTALFFAMAPGVVAGVVPWWMTGWRMREAPAWAWPLRLAGALLVVAGASVLVAAFRRFVVEGLGTPAPVAPTEHLVVGGLYRYVRNPMYVAVLSAILAQAALFWHSSLVWYAGLVAIAFMSFVRIYEEPTLAQKYGAEYEAYRRSVPAWIPRLRPWTGAR